MIAFSETTRTSEEYRGSSTIPTIHLDRGEKRVRLPEKSFAWVELHGDRSADDADEAGESAHHGDDDDLGDDLVAGLDGESGVVGHVQDLAISRQLWLNPGQHWHLHPRKYHPSDLRYRGIPPKPRSSLSPAPPRRPQPRYPRSEDRHHVHEQATRRIGKTR